ncbi:TPR repeat [Richelia sinica FACHB-800]|uniref:TPR repeat n=1 Tax=Richelia sinica FACHB-800 TaxID=1357546 RepID=A0A975Y5A1_9NOST|nr:UvrD-helicase domain-containing protein [Richelia sinica]MBD2665896.1 AAA family ATPase [Richelia sinica FACHB-800]QXE23999.1 TPR repeat [Richelia sinica FACHB-800]
MVSVVLHPDVVEFLRKNTTSDRLQLETWDCINKLKQRQFTGGLRVKRLQGVSKRVWEARINRGSRLIFTYNKSRRPETGEIEVYIAVQDICDHDHLNQTAARVRTPDAEWLYAETIEAVGNIESNWIDLSIEERNRIEFSQLEEEDYNPNFIYKDELLGNIQWQVVESPTEWYQAIINQDADLPIKITAEEYRLATSRNNILLKGSAGTGKTTVALYRLLHDYQQNPHHSQRLYVAYNPLLVNNVREQFYKLVGSHNPEIDHIFHFKTFRQLCLDILREHGQNYSPEDEVDFQVFEQWYIRQREIKKYPSALVWDQIRSIIKGLQLNLQVGCLNQEEYNNLSHKCQNIIAGEHRITIYRLFNQYQNKLRQDKRFDEIDLTRQALRLIVQRNLKLYHLIVCDEVQDLATLQLETLIQLTTHQANLYFAGDLHQMISPSGFDWKNLTNIFHNHQLTIPEEKELKNNFRSVGELVNLANQVLKIRYHLLFKSLPRNISQPVSNYGEKARIVKASLNEIQTYLNQLHPGDAILVRTDEDKEHLRVVLKSSLIFTIEEAKGLEFDTVFLVNFFQYRSELWHTALNTPARLKENEKPALILEFNLLYVAITRARRILNIWEAEISQFWQDGELKAHWEQKDIQTVLENRVGSQQKDWQQRGEYYLTAEFYLQAIECFKKSGDQIKEKESRAKLLQKEGSYKEAANIFVELANWQVAAQLFQQVEQWQDAANCWQKIGNLQKQRCCEIKHLECIEKWQDAAQAWEYIEKYEDAAKAFEKVQKWLEAANCWQKAGKKYQQNQKICEIRYLEVENKWDEAAQEWRKIRRLDEEERCWMNSNNEVKKAGYRARGFERQKNWLLAYEQYIIAEREDKVQEIRVKLVENLMIAGKENLEAKNYQSALVDFNKILEISPDYLPGYLNRAWTKIRQENYFGAIEDCNQALKINPEYADAYYCRGQVYQILSKQDIEKAMLIRQR